MSQIELFNIKHKEYKTCRTCIHRERWRCGGSIIQYCGKRKSNRTFNNLKKIKVTDIACELYQDKQ
ncbi:MAG: hypothetical protein H6552_00465 [Chitinophagales bacterium]|nr:hypothetical protein [Chitinophagales bacterium]